MLWRRFSTAVLLTAVLLSPLGAFAVPVDLTNPAFRPVRWFNDLTSGRSLALPPAAALAGTNTPTFQGHQIDVADYAVHGLTHPGTIDPNGETLRSVLSYTAGVRPSLIGDGPGGTADYQELPPVGGLASPPYSGYPTDQNPNPPQSSRPPEWGGNNVTCINPPKDHCGGAGAPYGMFEIPGSTAFTFAFGGSSTGPDPLDGVIFNFLIPGAVIEAGMNGDNDPFNTDPNVPPEGLGGFVALPGSFSSQLFTIDLTSTDPYGGRPVLSGTLTGTILGDSYGSVTPLFDNVVPEVDPNADFPAPFPGNDPNKTDGTPVGAWREDTGQFFSLHFGFRDTNNHTTPTGAQLGSELIGLNSRPLAYPSAADPNWMIDPQLGAQHITLTSVTPFPCDLPSAGNTPGVVVTDPANGICQFSPEHGYLAALAAAPTTPLTGVAKFLGLPGAWGLTTTNQFGAIPIPNTPLFAVQIGVFQANGVVDVGGFFASANGSGDNGFAEIPEPTSLLLLGIGVAGIAFVRRRHTNE